MAQSEDRAGPPGLVVRASMIPDTCPSVSNEIETYASVRKRFVSQAAHRKTSDATLREARAHFCRCSVESLVQVSRNFTMAAEPQPRALPQVSLRVLLIEDDPTVRTVLASYLDQRGHVTATAATRRDGIAALSTSKFDVVVTDVILPDGDGIDVMNRVSRMEEPGRVVAITGGGRYFGPGFFHRVAAALGAVVLEKPFGREEFIAAVEAGVSE
jgi:CheY-like chemotaxis protein